MTTSGDIDQTLEQGYNVRAARRDFGHILERWSERSESFRTAHGGSVDVSYGPSERSRLDIFTASTKGAPTLIYLHGGYWQSGDKSIYGFVAEPFVERAVNVVVMGYTLCPRSTIPDIVKEVRSGLAWLFRNGKDYGLEGARLNLCGHSAGGHLTALMLTTRWMELNGDLPSDLVKSGIPISGLYDLAPLRPTSINHAAGIDPDAARRFSPLFLPPASNAPVLAVVGGDETGAFHQQTEDFVERWSEAGARVERHVEPGVDHFDVVNRFADPGSVLFRKTLDWLV